MNEKEVDRVVALAQKLDTQIINFTPPHFTDKKTTWYSEYLARIKKNTRLAIAVINVEPKNVFFIIPEHKNASLTEIKKVTGDTTFNIASTDAISGTDAIKAQKILGGSIKNVFFSDKNNNKAGLLPGGAGG